MFSALIASRFFAPVVAALAAFALGFTGGYTYAWSRQEATIQRMKAETAETQKRAVEAARAQERAAAKITGAVETTSAEVQERVRVVYRTITRKVPVHVTPEIDRRYPLPCGFIRVLDAAAARVDPDRVSCGPGVPDDAPSDVTASEAGSNIAGNYGDATANAEQLRALQSWVREQEALRP